MLTGSSGLRLSATASFPHPHGWLLLTIDAPQLCRDIISSGWIVVLPSCMFVAVAAVQSISGCSACCTGMGAVESQHVHLAVEHGDPIIGEDMWHWIWCWHAWGWCTMDSIASKKVHQTCMSLERFSYHIDSVGPSIVCPHLLASWAQWSSQ